MSHPHDPWSSEAGAPPLERRPDQRIADGLDDTFFSLDPIDLPELIRRATLLDRLDRKYVVTPETAAVLLSDLGDRLRVLEIDSSRSFRYRSVYFDTEGRRSFHDAATGRRRRFKVRVRSYLDSGERMLELKTKGARGTTVKHRTPHTGAGDSIGEELEVLMAGIGVAQRPRNLRASDLRPSLVNVYRRSTFLDWPTGGRVTIDRTFRAWMAAVPHGRHFGLADRVVIETKSRGSHPGAVDRWLWERNHRPTRFSKYCTALAALDVELSSNRWHRTLRSVGAVPSRREVGEGDSCGELGAGGDPSDDRAAIEFARFE